MSEHLLGFMAVCRPRRFAIRFAITRVLDPPDRGVYTLVYRPCSLRSSHINSVGSTPHVAWNASQSSCAFVALDVGVQISHVEKKWRTVGILHYSYATILNKPPQLPGAHAQVLGCSLQAKQSPPGPRIFHLRHIESPQDRTRITPVCLYC